MFAQLLLEFVSFGNIARNPEDFVFAQAGDAGVEPVACAANVERILNFDHFAGVKGALDGFHEGFVCFGRQDFANGLTEHFLCWPEKTAGIGRRNA